MQLLTQIDKSTPNKKKSNEIKSDRTSRTPTKKNFGVKPGVSKGHISPAPWTKPVMKS
jgi:hypothetical protein